MAEYNYLNKNMKMQTNLDNLGKLPQEEKNEPIYQNAYIDPNTAYQNTQTSKLINQGLKFNGQGQININTIHQTKQVNTKPTNTPIYPEEYSSVKSIYTSKNYYEVKKDEKNPIDLKTFEIDSKKYPVIANYCENLTQKEFVTNPAIAREDVIKKTILILLTPDKSALLVGKAGIGKTAIVEGIAYKIQRNDVPDALKNHIILKINSSSLKGKITKDGKEEYVTNLVVEELKKCPKAILFIDEVHTLMGASSANGPMDLANILKPALDRGDIKAIGATTTIEYETYVVRDRAFLRRFDRVDVPEPDHDATVEILIGTIPKIESSTGIKMINNSYITRLLMEAIVDATSEFKRVYGLSAMYPDVSLSVLQGAFSNALFENRKEVGIKDVYMAIRNSKRIYPDSRVKECQKFRQRFEKICQQENIVLPDVKLEDIQSENDLDM